MGNFIRPVLTFCCIILATGSAEATTEVDQKYFLNAIGSLNATDNVDGLFADYVTIAYKDYFLHQSRFRFVDLSKANTLLAQSKIPYTKAIEDPEVLAQLSRSMKIQSLLRTRIRRQGPEYRFTVEWLHAPGMEVLASESFSLSDPGRGTPAGDDGQKGSGFPGLGDITGSFKVALDNLFKRVPFIGEVTGRDDRAVTVNLGLLSGVHRGDTLLVGTLDEVKKHPLLKQIVDWRITPTGRIEVDQADEAMAFCHVVSEEEKRKVGRYQKIIQIIPRSVKVAKYADSGSETVLAENASDLTTPSSQSESPPAQLGFGHVSLLMGTFTREASNTTATTGVTGSGFVYGARGEGELWITRAVFADFEMGYGTFGYSQKNIADGTATTASGVSGSILSTKLDLGYSYLVSGDFFGPKAWVKIGYLGNSVNLPISDVELTAPFSVKSVMLGLGGDIPLRGHWGAKLDLEFGLLNSGTEAGLTSISLASSHNARIYLGGYYRYLPRITFQFGFEIHGTGGTYDNGNTLSQKTFTLLPSVVAYF
ncbi:hypothetical protein WDW37_01740 [Bdellovibrionota bacterium FG-1]